MSKEHRFTAGEKVLINASDDFFHDTTEQYGYGPFEVLIVKDVPTNCGCVGAEIDLHMPNCRVLRARKIGHLQFVTVKLPDQSIRQISSSFLAPFSPEV